MSQEPGLNPLALLLLALSFAPLGLAWWRRRRTERRREPGSATRSSLAWEWPGAWAALGLAGMGLLAPALAIPDGVPSPAATLGEVAPWEGALDLSAGNPGAGNPAASDVTRQIQPWLLYLRHELRAGRLPGWNPYQYSGTPFWSNGQSAPLFPLHLLFAALPLPAGWLLLPWLRVLIAGLGLRALALELGLGRRAALAGGLIYPLSGMLTSFLLYPMGNALALVPWVLWAVERLAESKRWGVATLAIASGLQLLAGHPETAVHTALLSAVYLLVRGVWSGGAVGGWRVVAGAWGRFAAGWALAAAVAAVHIVPLAATLAASSRWQREAAAFVEPLARLLAQPLRLVLPDLYGHPVDGSWWGPYNYLATAVYAGAFALPLAAAGLLRLRSSGGPEPPRRIDRRWLGIVAILGLSFAGAYHLPGVRELLAALPIAGRAAHHRLIFGVELGLALLAAAGVDTWLARGGERRARSGLAAALAGGAVAAGLLAVGWWRFSAEWAARGLLGRQAVAAASVLGAAALVAGLWRGSRWAPGGVDGSDARPTVWARRAVLLVIVLIPLELIAVHARFNPGLSAAALYPPTPAVRFVQERLAAEGEGRVAATGRNLTPNAAMVYRLADVRGDDTVKLASYERFAAATFGSGHATFFRPIRRWDRLWLDRLSVRWVLGGPGEAAPEETAPGQSSTTTGWRLAYDGADARVWERPDPLPMVRWTGRRPAAGARSGESPSDGWGLEVVEHGLRDRPGRWRLRWSSPVRRLLVIGEAWDAGWRAHSADGESIAVRSAGDVLLGVELGPGAGELELVYRPVGLGWGAAVSGLALATLAALCWTSSRRRTRLEASR